MIADLATLGLSPAAKEARKRGLGGSDAATLMSGDAAKIAKLWEEKCGLREPDDLSDQIHVMLGHWTEPFNAAWYIKTTGNQVISRNLSVVHADIEWWRANLDGIVEFEDGKHGVWEAKHVAGREDLKGVVVPRYTAQVYHNMHAAGSSRGVLSILNGTSELRIFEFERDDEYLAALAEREAAFWECVEQRFPPPEWLDIAPPPPVTDFRSVSMDGVPEWAEAASIWLETRALAKTFEDAARLLRGMVERDVGEARGHGIVIARSKNGALTIREDKPKRP